MSTDFFGVVALRVVDFSADFFTDPVKVSWDLRGSDDVDKCRSLGVHWLRSLHVQYIILRSTPPTDVALRATESNFAWWIFTLTFFLSRTKKLNDLRNSAPEVLSLMVLTDTVHCQLSLLQDFFTKELQIFSGSLLKISSRCLHYAWAEKEFFTSF